MKKILTDIMGTTSPADYPKRLLMPNFAEKGAKYISNLPKEHEEIYNKISEMAGTNDPNEVVTYIGKEIPRLKKAGLDMPPEFLALTGLVNINSYKNGTLTGEFYQDIIPAFENWRNNGKGIYVFSNGSEDSQKSMFENAVIIDDSGNHISPKGNISHYVQKFFDTDKIGSKYEPDSYKLISEQIGADPKEITYINDILKELDAADKAGMNAVVINRDENKLLDSNKYKSVKTFLDVKFN